MVGPWQPGCHYNPGDVVDYRGCHYRIAQPHRSQPDWAPDCAPALWQRMNGNQHHQPQHGHHGPPQHHMGHPQQPQYEQQQQQASEKIEVVPANSTDPRKQSYQGFDIGGLHISDDQLKAGGGILGTAAAIGLGAFAWDKYKDSKDNKAEQQWGYSNWEQDARRRQGEYLEAIKNNAPLPPVCWVLTNGNSIPAGALKGGQEANGTPLYIARAFHENSVQIGKASADLRDGAHIPYGGKEIAVFNYEILLGLENAVKWVDGEGPLKNKGEKLVEGGREADGKPLYIAQAHIKGSVQPGKVGEHLSKCCVAYGNDEKEEKHYRYLCYA
ncbi:uncharacterized protein EV422DRAFT_600244 [Fimicolochytrium jonesii]|uniref:uncharacterized protein n=1 Tax=Fimicolochytrium jonesii TaxID=1396493 RepID=UPI0022FDB3D9|nr:uncharacterized protein EV422DRAFT_600244 [Fimicolochytrium jonesii]KAI8825758.1 hypothetical protein EV422DRAFT_600244 [Fimicolochytrium jonesii]